MFPWKTTFIINSNSNRPKYLQLADLFIQEISVGRLASGQKIPGTRKLSELLELNRKTVINTYEELISQGWLVNKQSSGTYITNNLPIIHARPIDADSEGINPKEIPDFNQFNFIPKFTAEKVNITFDGGSPDPRLAPIDWIYKECRSISRSKYQKHLLKYSDPLGEASLRSSLVSYLSESRGLNITPKNILITRGSQMGIYLGINTLINPGDNVVVGDSSYDASDWTITNRGGIIERIKIEDDGLSTELLEKLCKRKSVKLVYITPHHHFPTTVTLSNKKRIEILNLSVKYNFSILEDDYDYDFHYTSSPILPLASLNSAGHVYYIGSFSKIFAPTIRVGYLIGSEEFVENASKLRRIIDRQGDHVLQKAISESINSGELTRHLKKSLVIYRERRDLMAKLLKERLNNHIEFSLPEGGMAIWVRFKTVNLLDIRESLLKNGLSLDVDDDLAQDFNALRMGFASVNEDEIKNGIEILEKVVKMHAS